jgi:hypothetical protein
MAEEDKLKPELQPRSAARHELAVRPMTPSHACLDTTKTRDSVLPAGVSGENPQRTRCGHAAAARGKAD